MPSNNQVVMEGQPFRGWPPVRNVEERGVRKLYVLNIMPTLEELQVLESSGYLVVDVRTIENEVEEVLSTLKGLTESTIMPPYKDYKDYLELRMKALGLMAMKQNQQNKEDKKNLDTKDIDKLLESINTSVTVRKFTHTDIKEAKEEGRK